MNQESVMFVIMKNKKRNTINSRNSMTKMNFFHCKLITCCNFFSSTTSIYLLYCKSHKDRNRNLLPEYQELEEQ